MFNFDRFPFDWKTPLGYSIAFLSQAAGSLTILVAYIQLVNLIVGSCWIFIVIAGDITKDATAFNKEAHTSNGNRIEMVKRFRDLVQTYSDAKQ